MLPGGMPPNMQEIMQQAQMMQQQLQEAQASLEDLEVEGSSGGGLVKVTMSGSGELRGVVIAPDAVDPEDIETLQDLIVAAVRDGARAASEAAADKMGPITGGMGGGLGLPGF